MADITRFILPAPSRDVNSATRESPRVRFVVSPIGRRRRRCCWTDGAIAIHCNLRPPYAVFTRPIAESIIIPSC